MPAILNLGKSLDSASQRYSTLALCNLCACEIKDTLIDQSVLRPLIFLMRFPDQEIQRYSTLAVAGLAGNQNKVRIVQEGAMSNANLFKIIKRLCCILPDNQLELLPTWRKVHCIETHEFIAKANASKAFVALEAFIAFTSNVRQLVELLICYLNFCH